MAPSPPASPMPPPQRPLSAIARPAAKNTSRMSVNSKLGNGNRMPDEDGRTAVRVAVRIRPPLGHNDPGFELIPQRFQRSMVHTTSDTSLAIDSPHGRKLFVFDRVFGPKTPQGGVWEYLADSVNAFTQGYNVSLLAYGQSGAGKSYTMGTSGPGEQLDIDMMGVVPRAAQALFEKLDGRAGLSKFLLNSTRASSMSQLRSSRCQSQQTYLGDRKWSLTATYVEIYNEQLRDLLIPETMPSNERTTVAIREDAKGNIILTGLRQVEIHSAEDLMNALNFGSSIRQTDATAINAKSSRSHAVFSLNLVQRRGKIQGSEGSEKRYSVPLEAMSGLDMTVTTDSKLHFVDLAGSERLKNTGAQRERAKEGISINAGLASLGKVISQLSSRQSGSHVSYRDSKLTRLLQDSLGGNAITYMIACVTTAEFHLSETLNTVQYAQRTRSIQSKPQIQQLDDGDRQVVIERLRAEVSFLREQLRSSGPEQDVQQRVGTSLNERGDRFSERSVELENQLSEAQEKYSALSQRHARLISKMAKARERESELISQPGDVFDDSATDRLNRSSSFAQAVEQVVLEYEKTIESLEQSLASTRATLSTKETTLLEKETKCAYAENVNGQLQSRLQKLIDREASTENYLHDLERKLDGHASGEEKTVSIIMELRKENSRMRENEASCEDYIATLEERLAEADQDAELMQREIDRQEQVIERQRSLGKLDALLYELDHVYGAKKASHPFPVFVDEHHAESSFPDHTRSLSYTGRRNQVEAPIPEGNEESDTERGVALPGEMGTAQLPERVTASAFEDWDSAKIESVLRQYKSLRHAHAATLEELQQLQVRHGETQSAFAELLNEKRETLSHGQQVTAPSASKETISDFASSPLRDESLSTPLYTSFSDSSLDMRSRPMSSAKTDVEQHFAENAPPSRAKDRSPPEVSHALQQGDSERLVRLSGGNENAAAEWPAKYAELELSYNQTLDLVEELRTELSKVRAADSTAFRLSTPVIRRKSSQNVLNIDRAYRSFASLRNIASENFEGKPEVMMSFELNLNAAMHELHSRCERIQELEAGVAAAKKEMETKMTIISGLNRERSSLKASPMDMSMVATLRDQLEQKEKQLVEAREAHSHRERELKIELESLHQSVVGRNNLKVDREGSAASITTKESANMLPTPMNTSYHAQEGAMDASQPANLQDDDLGGMIRQLEADVARLEADLFDARAEAKVLRERNAGGSNGEQSVPGHRSTDQTSSTELENALSSAQADLAALAELHREACAELSKRQALIEELQSQVAAQRASQDAMRASLDNLRSDHARELADSQSQEQHSHAKQVEMLMLEHSETLKEVEGELSEARSELTKIATQVAFALGAEIDVGNLAEQIKELVLAQSALVEEQRKANSLRELLAEKEAAGERMASDFEMAKQALQDMLPGQEDSRSSKSVLEQLSVVRSKLSDLETKNKKHSRLVEELEEQLQSNFDEAQMASNRLSSLQTERSVQLEEATLMRAKVQAELDAMREQHAILQAKYHEATTLGDVAMPSSTTTMQKAPSHASLPSPPPAIPLPPLPGATQGTAPVISLPTSPSSTRSPTKDTAKAGSAADDKDLRLRAVERNLSAERQLTRTLEDALADLEEQTKKIKSDCDAWKSRATQLEAEVRSLKERPPADPQHDNCWSLQAVEEERRKRQAAEAARKQLEDRMKAINKGKKKKGSLNCF